MKGTMNGVQPCWEAWSMPETYMLLMLVYHNQCSVNFRTGKDVPCKYNSDNQTKKQKQAGRPQNVSRIDAFLKVVKYLEENDEEQFTVNDLCDKMNDFLKSSDDEAYSAVYMKDKLNDHFSDKVVITTIKNKANIVTLRKTAASIINEFYCTSKQTNFEAEKAKIVSTAAQLFKSEIKNFEIATISIHVSNVPDWFDKLQAVIQTQESVDEPSEEQETTREEWMILSDLNTLFDNSEQTPESTYDWHLDRANYSQQQIQEMPTWIKTNKEEYTIEEQYDVVDINSFIEMQKLAYDIVKSHFDDISSEKDVSL
ncbi:Hypothetical predicted protein [Paramuricea clavata]|uniref:Uncharacterized protein n=1 Tax=Paramuricea clavata TaxID=317549 RepID=A0A7D9EP05_PARCT|nr:Hypothetical predicted protein [Paramuricea clavata]